MFCVELRNIIHHKFLTVKQTGWELPAIFNRFFLRG